MDKAKPTDLAVHLAKYGIETPMGKLLFNEAIRLAIVLDGKNADYSSNNISKFGMQGILVRLSDKLERLSNLTAREKNCVNTEAHFESIEDTLLDIAGYGLIGTIVARGEWK
jgi:hypothetical protein